MVEAEKNLFVFAHLDNAWVPCGRLWMLENGPHVHAARFAYGLRYLDRANAIEVDPVSLGLADLGTIRGKELYPANDLPLFGGIRDAAPDAWGRRVIEAKLKVPANSLPESAYLLHAGSNRVGALDVRESINADPIAGYQAAHNLQHLMDAADRIEAGLPVPAHLDEIFVNGTALGGARPKASIRDENQILWLAKFSSRSDDLDTPVIEEATLRLANACGLTVPPVRTRILGRRSLMLIRRFDRCWVTPGSAGIPEDFMTASAGAGRIEKRLPFVSGLTLLGCHENQSREKSYAHLAQAIRRYCHPSLVRANNRELFARMVFNIFVTNDDDHLRNHGFIEDGALRGWRLSPLYDVMPRPTLASERHLHLGVGQAGRLATLDNALSAHAAFTLSQPEALSIISHVWQVVREWKVHFDSYGVAASQIERVAPAFRHVDDISTRDLRRRLP